MDARYDDCDGFQFHRDENRLHDGNRCDECASKDVTEQSRHYGHCHQCHKGEVILSSDWVDSHPLFCQRFPEQHFLEVAVHF